MGPMKRKMKMMMWTLMTFKQTNKQFNLFLNNYLSYLHLRGFLKIFWLIELPIFLSRFREKLVLLLDKNVLLLAYFSMCPPGKNKARQFFIGLFFKKQCYL